MSEDIADFVSMLVVKIYGKNSDVSQPVESFADCARKNGKEPLAACLDAGIESYKKVERLLRNQKRRLKTCLPADVYAKATRSYGSSRPATKYRNRHNAKVLEACKVTAHYEAIAKALLKEGLDSAKNQSLAPNTYYAMRACIKKSNYHVVLGKKIARALKFKPSAQNAKPGHSAACPPETVCSTQAQ